MSRAKAAGPWDLRCAKGLRATPSPPEPRANEIPRLFEPRWHTDGRRCHENEEYFDGAQGTIYIDGSALHPGEQVLATAAYAAVQVSSSGRVV